MNKLSAAQRFATHIDIVNIKHDSVFGIVEVSIVFDKTPGETYVFEIKEEDFDADKEAIAAEILRQLKS